MLRWDPTVAIGCSGSRTQPGQNLISAEPGRNLLLATARGILFTGLAMGQLVKSDQQLHERMLSLLDTVAMQLRAGLGGRAPQTNW